MKKILLLLAVCVLLLGCKKNPFTRFFQPDIKICDLYEKQSVYADSLVHLNHLTVIKCSSLLSYSCAELTDGKCSILLFTTRPYSMNEVVDIKARFIVLFQCNGKKMSALVTDSILSQTKDFLKPKKDLKCNRPSNYIL